VWLEEVVVAARDDRIEEEVEVVWRLKVALSELIVPPCVMLCRRHCCITHCQHEYCSSIRHLPDVRGPELTLRTSEW
jgi:hypothetical protein